MSNGPNLVNNAPPVNKGTMNLSELFAARSTPTFAVPYYDRNLGRMVMNEFDPMQFVSDYVSGEGDTALRMPALGRVAARDFNMGSATRDDIRRLPEATRNRLIAATASQYLKDSDRTSRMDYGDFMNLSEKEQQNILTSTRGKILEGLGSLSSDISVRADKRMGGSSVNYGGKNMMLDVAKAIDKLGIDKDLAKAIKRDGTRMFNNSTDQMINNLVNHKGYGMGAKNFQKVVDEVPNLKMYIDLSRNAREKQN